jgi:hypothetical protein
MPHSLGVLQSLLWRAGVIGLSGVPERRGVVAGGVLPLLQVALRAACCVPGGGGEGRERRGLHLAVQSQCPLARGCVVPSALRLVDGYQTDKPFKHPQAFFHREAVRVLFHHWRGYRPTTHPLLVFSTSL